MKKMLFLALLFAPVVMAANTATISFEAPTHYTDGTVIPGTVAITYNLYQGKDGAAKVKVGTITGTSTTINSGLTAGRYCWEVTAVANSAESEHSNEGCKTFEAVPNTVTITVT